jgi:hypothetical protein
MEFWLFISYSAPSNDLVRPLGHPSETESRVSKASHLSSGLKGATLDSLNQAIERGVQHVGKA